MKKLLLRYIPISWQKKWYHFKNPGTLDEVDIAYKLIANNDPHQIMFDVGAHVGNSLEPFARKGWKVHAFEPDPINRDGLKHLCRRFPNVTIESLALSDFEEAEVPFFTSSVSSGISSLLKFHNSHEAVNKVRVTTLSSYCFENNITHISFLKTDTEGYDLPVLRGNEWSKVKPRIIVSEFDNFKTKNLGYDLNDQVELLRSHGYLIIISEWYPIEEYGKVHRWHRFVTNASMVKGERVWGNVIAVMQDDWDSLLKIVKKYGQIAKE